MLASDLLNVSVCPVQQEVLRAHSFFPQLSSKRVFLYVCNIRDALLVPVWMLLEQQHWYLLPSQTWDRSSLLLPPQPVPVPAKQETLRAQLEVPECKEQPTCWSSRGLSSADADISSLDTTSRLLRTGNSPVALRVLMGQSGPTETPRKSTTEQTELGFF